MPLQRSHLNRVALVLTAGAATVALAACGSSSSSGGSSASASASGKATSSSSASASKSASSSASSHSSGSASASESGASESASGASGSASMLPPVIITESETAAAAKVGDSLDIVVTDPVNTKIVSSDDTIVSVEQGRNDGSATYNPGGKALKAGSATLTVTNPDSSTRTIEVTVS